MNIKVALMSNGSTLAFDDHGEYWHNVAMIVQTSKGIGFQPLTIYNLQIDKLAAPTEEQWVFKYSPNSEFKTIYTEWCETLRTVRTGIVKPGLSIVSPSGKIPN